MSMWSYDNLPKTRIQGAKAAHMISIDRDARKAIFVSSTLPKAYYSATLDRCGCTYYRTKGGPCKHMVRLAMELGEITPDGITFERQAESDFKDLCDALALAYGYYHLLHDPIMSDSDYDMLRKQYDALVK